MLMIDQGQSFGSCFCLLFFFLGGSSGCCPGTSLGPVQTLAAKLLLKGSKLSEAPKDLNLASTFTSPPLFLPGLNPLASFSVKVLFLSHTAQQSQVQSQLALWSKTPVYENILQQLSTLSRGVRIAVINLRSSTDHAQQEAELDLQTPILFFIAMSQMSIQPFRLPKPPKHTKRPKFPQITSFLCCFPNQKMTSLFLEKRTGSEGMKPLITKQFSPFLSHSKSWTGPWAVFIFAILLFSSLQRYKPYSPQYDLPVGSQQV